MEDNNKYFYSEDKEMNKKVVQNVKNVLEIVNKHKNKTEDRD